MTQVPYDTYAINSYIIIDDFYSCSPKQFNFIMNNDVFTNTNGTTIK